MAGCRQLWVDTTNAHWIKMAGHLQRVHFLISDNIELNSVVKQIFSLGCKFWL